MTLPKVTTLGERLDFELHQGASLLPVRHTLLNPNGTPVDLTGATVRGQIRRKALDVAVVVSFTTRIAPTPTEGWYEFALTDEQTQGIPCGDLISDPASKYEWDMEVEDALGDVRCTFYGTVRVKAGTTRP